MRGVGVQRTRGVTSSTRREWREQGGVLVDDKVTRRGVMYELKADKEGHKREDREEG